MAQYVHFVPSAAAKADCSPKKASATPQKLMITGKAKATPYILCRLGTEKGAPATRLNIGSYKLAMLNANFYKVQATGLVPDATSCAQFQSGAGGFMKDGVSSTTLTDNGTKTIEYDFSPKNGKLDIDTTLPGGGPEWKKITAGLGAHTGQKLLHVKPGLRVKIDTAWQNATGLNWGEWIIVTDSSLDKKRTLAHELLHNLGLDDTGPSGSNTKNIMYYITSATKYFVGHFKVERVKTATGISYAPKKYEKQWDKITR